MKKKKSISIKKAFIDVERGIIQEDIGTRENPEVATYQISEIFKDFDGECGVTITIAREETVE